MGFFDQMKQLSEIKQKMEDVKKRLDTITVEAENDWVKVTANGNRKITGVNILKADDAQQLEVSLVSALNQVLEKSDNVMQSEMMGATKGMLPNVPGLG